MPSNCELTVTDYTLNLHTLTQNEEKLKKSYFLLTFLINICLLPDKCHTCETHTAVAMKTCDALAKCMLTCDNGYIEGGTDANGCKTCQCAQVCHECEVAKPQVVQQVQVVTTGTKEHCNECEHTSGKILRLSPLDFSLTNNKKNK